MAKRTSFFRKGAPKQEAPIGVLRKKAPLPQESRKKAAHTEISGNGSESGKESAGSSVHELHTNPRGADAGPVPGSRENQLKLDLARETTRRLQLEEQQSLLKEREKSFQEKEKALTETVRAQSSAFMHGYTADVYSQLPPEVVDHTTHAAQTLQTEIVNIPSDTGTHQVLDRLLPILGNIGRSLQAMISSSSSSDPLNTFLVLMSAIFIFSMTLIIMLYWIIITKLLGVVMAMAVLYAVTHSFSIHKRAEVEKGKAEVEKGKAEVEKERVEVAREWMRLMGPPSQDQLTSGMVPRALMPPVGLRRVEELTD